MDENKMVTLIAEELGIPWKQVWNTVELLDHDNTVPFIARYRKEVTGSLDEDKIRTINQSAVPGRLLPEKKAWSHWPK